MSWTGAGELDSPWSSPLPGAARLGSSPTGWRPGRSGPRRGSAVTWPTPTRSGSSAAIIEALGRAWGQPDIGEDARGTVPESLEGQDLPDVIAALADDLEGADGAGVLVVDDFHLTDGAGAGRLALLLEYRPPSLQLVVATRADPPLRLHRMRANNELVELRDEDLALSGPEESQGVPRWVRRTARRAGPGCGPPPQ